MANTPVGPVTDLPAKNPSSRAVLLVAHGSSRQSWYEMPRRLHEIAQHQAAGLQVALSFLAHGPATPMQEAARLCATGITTLRIVPVFLATGGHVTDDVQALAAEVRLRFPMVTVTVAAALGQEPSVLQAMAQAAVVAD